MAQPASRQELRDYCLRQLGAPVLEINLDDDQIDDAIDDALQYFRERHFNGAEKMYLKHEFTDDDVTRFTTANETVTTCLLYTSPSPRDRIASRMPSSA